MFIIVSKEPYTYVYGTHKGVQKKAKVPFGVLLETVGDEPYGGSWKLKTVPEQYWGTYDHTGYPEWWIAETDVSPAAQPVPEPPPEPGPEAGLDDGDLLGTLVGIMKAYGVKSITLE